MSRERRQYFPLEVDEHAEHWSSTRIRRERAKPRWLEENPTCTSALSFLPSFLTPCFDSGVQAAFDDLEEKFSELESRYTVLQDAVKQEREDRTNEAEAARSRSAALKKELEEAEQRSSLLQEGLASSKEQIEKAERQAREQREALAAEQAEKATAHENLRAAAADAQRLTLELKAEQEDHLEAQKQLSIVAEDSRSLKAALAAAEAVNSRDRLQLKESEAEQHRLSQALKAQQEESKQLSGQLQAAAAKLRQALTEKQREQDSLSEQLLKGEQERARLSAELDTAQSEAAQASKEAAAQLQLRAEECHTLYRELSEREATAARLQEEARASSSEAKQLVADLASVQQSLGDSEEQMRGIHTEAQAAKAELAAAMREAATSQEMLKVAQQEAACLAEDLEAAHEEGFRLADLLQATQAQLAAFQASAQNGHQGISREASASGESSRPDQEDGAHELGSPPSKAASSLWDSAADIARPHDKAAASSPGLPSPPPESGNGLHEDFQSRAEWRDLWEQGTSAGWLAFPQEVERSEVLGKGNFGVTYLGSLRGQEAAIKCVRLEHENHYRIFVREVGALARIRHSNVMQLLGAVIQPPQTCWLVVEYLSGGNLAEWLYGRNGRSASRKSLGEKLAMAEGIARGMLALHASEPAIMHRDLKPTNVLLDAHATPKLADFGLCREHLEDQAYTYTGETGSYTYMSPEMMRGDIYGPSTDVYSFAILLTEVLKQRPPFEEFYLTPMQTAEGVAYNDLRPQLPSSLPGGLKPLVEACWDPEPEGRPGFDVIVPALADIIADLPPPRRGLFS